MSAKVLDLIVFDADAFGLKLLLHRGEPAEVVLARQHTKPVDHPMRRHVGQAVGRIHGVADGSGSARAAEVAGNGTVAGDSAFGNLAHDGVNPLKKIRFWGAGAKRNLR